MNYIIVYNARFNENQTQIAYQGNLTINIENSEKTEITGSILINHSGNKEINGFISIDNTTTQFSFAGSPFSKEKEIIPKLYYAFLVSICYIFSFGVLARHIQKCLESLSFAEKTSMWTLAMISVYELGFAL